MRWTIFARVLTLPSMLAAMATTINAASLNTAAYTVTDLGPGGQYGTSDWERHMPLLDANGQSVVIAGDGKTVYAFPHTTTFAPQSALASITPPLAAPIHSGNTYGNPAAAYSTIDSHGLLTANGLLIGQDNSGVGGHGGDSMSAVVVSQRQSDGTYGAARVLYTSNLNISSGGGDVAQALDANLKGEILGSTQGDGREFFSTIRKRTIFNGSPYSSENGPWITSSRLTIKVESWAKAGRHTPKSRTCFC